MRWGVDATGLDGLVAWRVEQDRQTLAGAISRAQARDCGVLIKRGWLGLLVSAEPSPYVPAGKAYVYSDSDAGQISTARGLT